MSHTFMADQSMIPPLPMDADPVIPAGPANFQQGQQRPADGVPKFRIVAKQMADGTFKNVEMVDILTPGDPKATPCHKVTDVIRQMYPREYDAFRRGQEAPTTGWPVDQWSLLSPAEVHHYKSLNIFAVEEIAQMADSNLHRIPMGRTRKNQAIAALRNKQETDSVEAMRRKDEMNQQAISSLEDRLAEMQARLDAQDAAPTDDTVPAPAKRGPGRPRNAEAG